MFYSISYLKQNTITIDRQIELPPVALACFSGIVTIKKHTTKACYLGFDIQSESLNQIKSMGLI